MRIIFLILLIPIILFAQYGEELSPDSSYDTGGWTTTGSWVVSGGSANNDGSITAASLVYQNIGEDVLFTGFEYRAVFRIGTFVSGGIGVRHSGASYVYSDLNIGSSDTTISLHWAELVDYPNIALVNRPQGFNGQILSGSWRQRLDTLWIDLNQADETHTDTTKTHTEAFQIRGAHAGGVFITVAGIYNENFSIDSSFHYWGSVGGVVNIDTVDFNNVTATVDLLNLTITTKLNDSNVTYLNVPVTDTSQDKGLHLNRKLKLNSLLK